ncbi:hypothetical protein IQ06DRAFT_369700 [Phaeosphaeriaceae sp. SRC1lsM3a]|nr:hypothetical protein IQ06DRAFT_369700 [Stagonospora sp. SRC1lsM3a]
MNLPQELICEICVHLNDEDLRTASFVSSRFRSAAEDCASGHRNHIVDYSTHNHFLSRYSGFRHRFIEEVQFRLYVPSADPERDCYRERSSEQLIRDSAFTNQVRELFAALKEIETRAGTRNPGSYRLLIVCDQREVPPDGCPHGDHAHRRTHLLEPNALPVLESIRSFELQNAESGLKLDYRVLVDLMTALPNVEDLTFHTGTDEWTPSYKSEPATNYPWEYNGLRRDARHDFGRAMAEWTAPCTLKRVNLDFLCRGSMLSADNINHWHSQPDLVSPAIMDPFSKSLHVLSYHLREMTIRAQIDESFFWPQDDTTPTWPHLERLFIMFHMVAPSGSWYFEGPRGEGRDLCGHELDQDSYPSDDEDWCSSDDYDRSFENHSMCLFRVSPNLKVLRPFLQGFANAAANMPKLKQTILWSPLRWEPSGDDEHDGSLFDYFQGPDDAYMTPFAWGVAYCIPGEEPMLKIDKSWPKCNIRHLWWEVGSWRPDSSLAEAFRKIGRTQHGDDLREVYGHGDVHGLTYRYDFEEWTPWEQS